MAIAEAIVSVAIEKIADLLIDETTFLGGVKGDVERLKAELTRMQEFLKVADQKKNQDERVINWVAEIRELAYDADDVLDTFLLKIANREAGICRIVKKVISLPSKLFRLHKIGGQIRSINAKLADISNSLQTYGITSEVNSSSRNEMQRRLRRVYPDDEEQNIVSLESTTKEVMDQLMKEEDPLRVVSIVGMGGLGKTTLAKKVYNQIEVKRHFDCCSWAFMSQQSHCKEVLQEILIAMVSSDTERQEVRSMMETELVMKLYDFLKQKKYLVVLDDIWSNQDWDCIKSAFPNGKRGSKILFTTRIKDVALYADPWSSPIEPPVLTDAQGWELLKKKAFQEEYASNRTCIVEFERLGMEMVRKCGCLPLAIAVLGGLLANKSLKEWEIVRRDVSGQFNKLKEGSDQYAGVDWILALSYRDLPFNLKPCFLYLSQFPEDWEIHKRELIRMWISEGFISQPVTVDETIEDVGEQYLEELVSRCMVNVSRRDHTGIGIKTFRMHDMMRDVCVSKAREENFLGVLQQHGNNADASNTNLNRRIATNCGKYSCTIVPNKEHGSRLRSLLYLFTSESYSCMSENQVNCIFRNFKLLRVLKLKHAKLESEYIPEKIGTLVHLRYLGLKDIDLNRAYTCNVPSSTLSASIGNLKCLCTLDLRSNEVKIPDVLWKLVCLRHLLLDKYYEGEFRLDTLRNLESLKWVKAKDLIRNDGMLKLTNLRHLAVEFHTTQEAKKLVESPIFRLGHLRTLKMEISNKCSFPNWELLSSCDYLTKLWLRGRILEDPKNPGQNLNFLPASLAKLTLRDSKLKEDPMFFLEKLHNLRWLWLIDEAYTGSKMVCSAHGFPRLEFLGLNNINEVEEWEIEEGAMSCLKTLFIYELPKLRMLPEGLKLISSIQKLAISECTEEFARRVKVIDGVEGEDFYKLRHIPNITLQ